MSAELLMHDLPKMLEHMRASPLNESICKAFPSVSATLGLIQISCICRTQAAHLHGHQSLTLKPSAFCCQNSHPVAVIWHRHLRWESAVELEEQLQSEPC